MIENVNDMSRVPSGKTLSVLNSKGWNKDKVIQPRENELETLASNEQCRKPMSVRFIQVRSSNLIIFSVSLGLKTDGQTPGPLGPNP